MRDITYEVHMIFYFGYVLPAILFFILCCWDTLDTHDKLTIGDLMFAILGAIIPIMNWYSAGGIITHLIQKYDLIRWDFVIYKRKK